MGKPSNRSKMFAAWSEEGNEISLIIIGGSLSFLGNVLGRAVAIDEHEKKYAWHLTSVGLSLYLHSKNVPLNPLQGVSVDLSDAKLNILNFFKNSFIIVNEKQKCLL